MAQADLDKRAIGFGCLGLIREGPESCENLSCYFSVTFAKVLLAAFHKVHRV